eukprot:2502555-Lingulodinium_polyedra.AAC.1
MLYAGRSIGLGVSATNVKAAGIASRARVAKRSEALADTVRRVEALRCCDDAVLASLASCWQK